jgi:precorrin-6B methylase 2
MSRDPSAELMRLIDGFQVSQAIHVAASLGIADLLENGSRSSDQLATSTKCDPDALLRLLRALASVGVLNELPNKRFELTPVGDGLRATAPASRKAWACYVGRPYVWQSWGALNRSVQSGRPAFDLLHGMGIWKWRSQQPQENEIFDAAMTGLSRAVTRSVIAAYDFSAFEQVVDVGGGQGALLAAILAASPSAHGVLFDLPHVVAAAPPVLAAAGVTDRCRIMGGNVFETLPEGGDLYIVKSVLMDEPDRQAVAILEACKRAMRKTGKLMVIERLVAPPNEGRDSKFGDLTMMVMTGGRERTVTEFTLLFESAGFRLEQQVDTPAGTSLLIGVPI